MISNGLQSTTSYLNTGLLSFPFGMADKHQQFKSEVLNATQVVHAQLTRLKMLDKKFTTMDNDLRHQISMNIKAGNNQRARALANELSNIRRVKKTTQDMSLALEVVVIRFSTINEFAMVLETISPTVEMIKDIQKDISKAIPTANEVFAEMNNVTSEVLVNSTIKADVGKVVTPVDKDALAILDEIEGVLENEAKAKLPDVPEGVPSQAATRKSSQNQNQEMEENQVMI